MKQIIIFLFIFTLCSQYNAQDSKVASAFNFLKAGELDKAKTDIDLAVENGESMYKSKTWFVRALVYHTIYEANKPELLKVCDKPLTFALEAYLKTIEYDKTKEFNADITKRLNVLSSQFKSKGAKDFQIYNYSAALESFQQALQIENLPFFLRTDTNTIYNAAVSANLAKKYLISIDYFNKLIDLKYGKGETYLQLSEIYKSSEKIDLAKSVLLNGLKLYPENSKLVDQLINIYISLNQTSEARQILENIVSKGTNNGDYYYFLAGMYDYATEFEKVKSLYLKSIELNPKNGNAYFKLGMINYNLAVKENEKINSITDDMLYKTAKAKVEEYFKQALPNFEKARELNISENSMFKSLKFLYQRYNQKEKLNEINKLLGE
jgi:tetratricopeptide (TPR) repeat protein